MVYERYSIRTDKKNMDNGDILPEYDFTKAVKGKHYRPLHEGFSVHIHQTDGTTTVKRYKEAEGVIILDSDVRPYFPDSKAVNNALRHLIALVGEISSREEKTIR
jgi:hypothetical protein